MYAMLIIVVHSVDDSSKQWSCRLHVVCVYRTCI